MQKMDVLGKLYQLHSSAIEVYEQFNARCESSDGLIENVFYI